MFYYLGKLIMFQKEPKIRKVSSFWKSIWKKAYDRLEWNFIHDILKLFHFPQSLCKLIMHCVSSTSVRLLFNGNQLETFYPSRGLRQDDPLSPYLSILCLEYCSRLIDGHVQEGKWRGIRIAQGSTPLTHLFFADDLILMGEATRETTEIVDRVLKQFCDLSGQRVNRAKSRLVLSRNVTRSMKVAISHSLGVGEWNSLGKYLGFLEELGFNRASCYTFW